MEHFRLNYISFIIGVILTFFQQSAVYADETSKTCLKDFYITKKMCDEFQDEIERSKRTIILSCQPYFQNTTYTCGPSAVMMVLRYYKRINSCLMNRGTELEILDEMRGTTEGTTPTQVSGWLKNKGFKVYEGPYVSTQIIIKFLKKGIPVIMSTGDHWLVAIGYNAASPYTFMNKDEIVFADSSVGKTTMTKDVIDTLWRDAQVGKTSCVSGPGYYIAAVPR